MSTHASKSLVVQWGSNARLEWPTLGLVVITWISWFGLILSHQQIPAWVLMPLAACVLCLHGSLQHETIHGHPTPWRGVNPWLVNAPLSLWIPYRLYRRSHLRHHHVSTLTHPQEDPESFYMDVAAWDRASKWWRLVMAFNQTLLGRLTIGPALVVGQFYLAFFRGRFARDEVVIMCQHIVIVVLLMTVLYTVFSLHPLKYLICFAYPGVALTLLRSFVEHQRAVDGSDATAIVDCRNLLSLLFLNNNFHWVHHHAPMRPWYELPALYDRMPNATMRDVTVYRGYRDVVRRYLVQQRDRAWQG